MRDGEDYFLVLAGLHLAAWPLFLLGLTLGLDPVFVAVPLGLAALSFLVKVWLIVSGLLLRRDT